MTHMFDPSILRAYDIRGIFGDTLHLNDAYVLGRVFATYLNKPGATVVVGRDGRLSSPALAEKLIQGLIEGGLDVKNVGLGPTPMIYFAQKYLNADAALMVSGSHNPGNYNGFKMTLATGPFFGQDIQFLNTLAAQGGWVQGPGKYSDVDISSPYMTHLIDDFHQHYPSHPHMRIAWDPGHGAACDVLKSLVKRLPGDHILINDVVDGHFPHHHPDPSIEANLEQLKEVVLTQKCDFGLAFDGDGDRIGAIDARGRVIWGDMLTALFAEEILSSHPGASIIMDIKSSQVFMNYISHLGGIPKLYRTGHSYIKAYMKENKSPLAGELSGHMFFADRYYGFDDALYAALRFIGRFASTQETPAQWLDRLPETFISPEITFQSTSADKFNIVEAISRRLTTEKADFIAIDGVRVNREQGWWLVRASNTQDILVARLESASAQGLEKLREDMSIYLRPFGIEVS